jgi:hypothetical protein
MNEWVNGWVNELVSEWMSECIYQKLKRMYTHVSIGPHMYGKTPSSLPYAEDNR